jgi:hypothetical protein
MREATTVFKRVDYTLDALLHYVDIGDIGLPDLQRPFVWTATKVRDLFDSMYRGFPVGYLLFWANSSPDGVHGIGLDDKAHKIPSLLIVDGQQRLTSLYSVFRGKPVLDQNWRARRIEIAFRPRDGKFAVTDAAIRMDPEFVPDIAELWSSGKSSWSLVNDFLQGLERKQTLSAEDKERVSHNLDRLFDLQKYPITALEISSTVDEEQVADIFVRINSEGVKLSQADFILTLLSVFGEDIRVALEAFCRECRTPPGPGAKPSPYNHFNQPGADQMGPAEIRLPTLTRKGHGHRRGFPGATRAAVRHAEGEPPRGFESDMVAPVLSSAGGSGVPKRRTRLLRERPPLQLHDLPHREDPFRHAASCPRQSDRPVVLCSHIDRPLLRRW